MSYVIRITYKDDKTVALYVPENKVQEYFECLNAGNVFINDETNTGFWTTVDQIRHIIVQEAKVIEDEGQQPGNENQESSEALPDGKKDSESGNGINENA